MRTQPQLIVNKLQNLWDKIFYSENSIMEKHPQYRQILIDLKTSFLDQLNLICLENAQEVAENYPTLIFCLYRDNVIDLTNIIHSGGCFMNYQARGREISRFINGSFDLETYKQISKHQHTKFVLQQLKRQTVGKIDTSSFNLIRKQQKQIQYDEVQTKSNQQFEEQSIWKLSKIINISPDLVKLEFTSNTHLVLNSLPGIAWLGRHIALRPTLNPYKERLYTTVIFSTDNNTKVRNQLIEKFEQKINNGEIINYDFSIETVSLTYPLLIKKYQGKNPLSAYMCRSINQKFTFYGPFGQGFGLTNDANKIYYFILGGTTVPILDLIDFLLKKAIYQVIKQLFGEVEAKRFNPYNQQFDDIFGKNFKVVLFLSGKNFSDFAGLDLCTKLLEISQKYKLNLFEMVFRCSGYNRNYKQKDKIFELARIREKRFDLQFLRENVEFGDLLGKIFLCGPHEFVNEIHSSLSTSVPRSQLIII